MVEQEPQPKEEKRIVPEEVADFFKRHRLARYPTNIAMRLMAAALIPRHPHMKDAFFQEGHAGMLEDSIFSTDIHAPNPEGTSLAHEIATAGRYVGYDFNRVSEFGKRGKKRQLLHGRLWTVPLDKIIDNPSDNHTSSYLINLLDIEQLAMLQTPTIDELLGYGFIEETTYKEAYDKVGLYHKFRLQLSLENILDKTIYRVTPKGNSLVLILPDFGASKREPKGDTVLKPALSS